MEILAITCDQLAPIMRVLAYLINLVKWAVPIVLIVMIIIDFVQATTANDEKKMKEAQNKVGKRIVYALVIFLVPTIVSLLFKTFNTVKLDSELSGPTDWIGCYNRFN